MQKLSKRIEYIESTRIQPQMFYVATVHPNKQVNVEVGSAEYDFTFDEYINWKRVHAISDKQLLEVQIVNTPQPVH